MEFESRNSSTIKVEGLLQKFTSCCIALDMRMLHIKIFISRYKNLHKQTKMVNLLATCK